MISSIYGNTNILHKAWTRKGKTKKKIEKLDTKIGRKIKQVKGQIIYLKADETIYKGTVIKKYKKTKRR